MIKRTLYFKQDAYLSVKKEQLLVRYPDSEREATIPIEDIGVVILDHYRLTLSSTLLNKLLQNNVAVITCDEKHLPLGMFLNLDGHSQQLLHLEAQISTTPAKKDRLWKQIIRQKLLNQARVLKKWSKEDTPLIRWSKQVQNGDVENKEGRGASYYWPKLMADYFPNFKRSRFGAFPNSLFNYGYTILRGVVARALVASGLHPTLGIHHHNKYTAYGLADDVMEPYRPLADALILQLLEKYSNQLELARNFKVELLRIPVLDVIINQQKSPLMLAVQQTTASLQQCFAGTLKQLKLPSLV